MARSPFAPIYTSSYSHLMAPFLVQTPLFPGWLSQIHSSWIPWASLPTPCS